MPSPQAKWDLELQHGTPLPYSALSRVPVSLRWNSLELEVSLNSQAAVQDVLVCLHQLPVAEFRK